jgi:hypothetical protein
MEAFSKPTVEALHRKILAVASRPLVEFNRYEVLELLDSLRQTAHDLKHEKYPYYRVVYHMLSEKVHGSTAYFREVLLSLLGDKEQEKVMKRVSKVDKRYARWRDTENPRLEKRWRPSSPDQCLFLLSPTRSFSSAVF